jgi:hypothetical protein
MGVLTDFTQAVINTNLNQIYGKIVTKPALFSADVNNQKYVCDVDVGITDPSGFNQTTQVQSAAQLGTILKNVPVASNNLALIYADVGNPVILTRTSPAAQWQVTGFANSMPGTFTVVMVDVSNMAIGTIQETSITSRVLTLGEIGLYAGGWGVAPFGATAIFVGSIFEGLTGG